MRMVPLRDAVERADQVEQRRLARAARARDRHELAALDDEVHASQRVCRDGALVQVVLGDAFDLDHGHVQCSFSSSAGRGPAGAARPSRRGRGRRRAPSGRRGRSPAAPCRRENLVLTPEWRTVPPYSMAPFVPPMSISGCWEPYQVSSKPTARPARPLIVAIQKDSPKTCATTRARASADRPQHAELAGALHDRHQQRVEDAQADETVDEEGDQPHDPVGELLHRPEQRQQIAVGAHVVARAELGAQPCGHCVGLRGAVELDHELMGHVADAQELARGDAFTRTRRSEIAGDSEWKMPRTR